MALIDIEKDFPFLGEVELNNRNENQVIKNIKFNKEEMILLKYIKYIDKNFGTYVKQLIESDIYSNLGDKNVLQENKTVNTNLNEDYLMKLIEKVIDKKTNENSEEKAITQSDIEDDLVALGIPKR